MKQTAQTPTNKPRISDENITQTLTDGKFLPDKTTALASNASQPILFGIRHLSPAGAWNLRKLLDAANPDLVLVEGPSDFTEELSNLTHAKVKPPVAIMAYTSDCQTLLYPLAIYSPEYQAILWAHEHQKECRFIDLPSSIFLGFSNQQEFFETNQEENLSPNQPYDERGEEGQNIYQKLDALTEEGHETFWERTMEHFSEGHGYERGAAEFGKNLRDLSKKHDYEYAESWIREAYMNRQIKQALESGISPEKIVVVTGAYHVEGLRTAPPLSDDELKRLPMVEIQKTLMPYSYYRLSTRSGYGAGNKAPAYYELLWEGFQKGEADYAARSYLSRLATWQRQNGNVVSSAEVIEAVRLSISLAQLQGYQIPALCDLRDAAKTCMGHGHFGEIAQAVADTEIGTKIGALPQGVSRTSIQNDFYRQLKELNLEKYHSVTAYDLHLDLREKLTVKSEKAAYMDLKRSFFLHRLRVLGISFVRLQPVQQERATWAEHWILQWTPEAEIEIVEAQLKGDTVLLAAAFQMKEEAERGESISAIAHIIKESFLCGIPDTISYASSLLQKIAVQAAAVDEIAKTVHHLSLVIQYGDIRSLSSTSLLPILEQLFLRACLLLPENCICDDTASMGVIESLRLLNEAQLHHDFLSENQWLRVLKEIAGRDDLNTKISGYAAAILLERGKIDGEELEKMVQRRLSRGTPADLGAGWFEGLSMKNRYALIMRLSLWESLDCYLDSLEDEEFKRALLFLRRAFADFSPKEKNDIAENLGELWKLNPQQVSEAVNAPLSGEEAKLLSELDDFDFGDI